MPAPLKGTAASLRWDSREDLYLGASCSKWLESLGLGVAPLTIALPAGADAQL